MQRLNASNFQWVGEKIECPNETLLNKDNIFYTECIYNWTKYEVGIGANVKINSKVHVSTIHYFYEISDKKSLNQKTDKIVVVELFYKPNDIIKNLARTQTFDDDLDVIKKDEEELIHLPITVLRSRCALVYGLEEEDPQDLLEEFIETITDSIYVCRFVATLKDNLYYLKGSVFSEMQQMQSPVKFKVTHVDDSNDKIKMKLKKYRNSESPTSLMKQLNISQQGEIDSIKKSPVVVLNRIGDDEPKDSHRIRRKSSRILFKKQNEPPVRSSMRHESRKSYVQYYESPENVDVKMVIDSSDDDRTHRIDETPKSKRIADRNLSDTDESQQMTKQLQSPRKRRVTLTRKHETENELKRNFKVTEKENLTDSENEFVTKKTPKQKRIALLQTPKMERVKNPVNFPETPMSRARLGLSALPESLPCREKEYQDIYQFVYSRIREQSSGCMYISGVPGTGKTMTVCKVMNDLAKKSASFEFLHLNALALTQPRQIYVEIVKKLLNKKMHWEQALKEMQRFFKAKKKKCTHVLLIDELDKLCNRKQDVIYNLLDLPFQCVTSLIVITIANTMDLPERILTNKVNSRLGLVRLTFKPYQYKDLVRIVSERLRSSDGSVVFKSEALELVARKVAAVSGDARRALSMCSRATEIAEERDEALVNMAIVDQVVQEMTSSSKVKAIQCCSKLEQLLLTAIANEVQRTGNEEVSFMNALHNLENLCLLENFKLPPDDVCLFLVHNLGGYGLLITQSGRLDLTLNVMLNVSVDDIYYALNS